MHGTCPVSTRPTDRALFAAIPLLAIVSLPDAMVVPVLKGLLVDRYGVSVGAAHWFLGVSGEFVGAGRARVWEATSR